MNRAYRKATERKEEMRTREKKGKRKVRRGNDKILGGLMFLGQDVPDSPYVGD